MVYGKINVLQPLKYI